MKSPSEKLRCKMCGRMSHKVVGGICEKAACERQKEEGRAEIQEQIAQSEKLAIEYAGQGYE